MTEREMREDNSRRLAVIEAEIEHLVVAVDGIHIEMTNHVKHHRELALWVVPTLLMVANLVITVLRW